MNSGSLSNRRIEQVINYHQFRNSIINVMKDADFELELYDEDAMDHLTLLLLRNLFGDEKLVLYMRKMLPPITNLN